MLRCRQILVSTVILGVSAVNLSACGQQGPLYLPTDPAAAQRATLPETLFRSSAVTARPGDAETASPPAKSATPATTPVPP